MRESILRTVVPLIAGFIITTLLKLGLDIDKDTVIQFTYLVVTAVYYAAVRYAEVHFASTGKWFSRIFLGSSKKPDYDLAA